jgi:hypothetical protein
MTYFELDLKSKIKETGSSVKEQMGHMKKDSKFLKKIIQSKNIVQMKTDSIAILVRKKGFEEEFFKEFDNITKEGYQMMHSEELTDPVPVINVTIGYLYYFQHKKYIN